MQGSPEQVVDEIATSLCEEYLKTNPQLQTQSRFYTPPPKLTNNCSESDLHELASKTKSIKIHNRKLIGAWHYPKMDENCPICFENLNSVCDTCILTPNRKCYILVGVCNHKFHQHCLNKLEGNNLCPLCRRPWVTELSLSLDM